MSQKKKIFLGVFRNLRVICLFGTLSFPLCGTDTRMRDDLAEERETTSLPTPYQGHLDNFKRHSQNLALSTAIFYLSATEGSDGTPQDPQAQKLLQFISGVRIFVNSFELLYDLNRLDSLSDSPYNWASLVKSLFYTTLGWGGLLCAIDPEKGSYDPLFSLVAGQLLVIGSVKTTHYIVHKMIPKYFKNQEDYNTIL